MREQAVSALAKNRGRRDPRIINNLDMCLQDTDASDMYL